MDFQSGAGMIHCLQRGGDGNVGFLLVLGCAMSSDRVAFADGYARPGARRRSPVAERDRPCPWSAPSSPPSVRRGAQREALHRGFREPCHPEPACAPGTQSHHPGDHRHRRLQDTLVQGRQDAPRCGQPIVGLNVASAGARDPAGGSCGQSSIHRRQLRRPWVTTRLARAASALQPPSGLIPTFGTLGFVRR